MKYLCPLWFVLSSLWAETSIDPDSLFTTSGRQKNLVEMIYKKCESEAPLPREVTDNSSKMREFNGCVQKELDANKEQVAQFKEKVQQGSEDAPIRTQQSKTQKLLTQYLQDRFDTKVRGEDKRIVNHADYFKFYQSQLSQLVSITLNSYCINTDTQAFRDTLKSVPPSQKRADLVEYLRSEFGNRPFTLLPKKQRSEAFEKNKELLKDPMVGEIFVQLCAIGITKICHDGIDKESEQEACQVLEGLRKLNRAITNNEKRIQLISCPRGKNPSQCDGFALERFPSPTTGKTLKHYNPYVQGESISELTSMTASEFQKNVVEKIETVCRDNERPSKECLREIMAISGVQSSDLEKEDKKVLAEFQIQTLIVKERIGNEESDEGYNKKDVVREIASEGGGEDVISQIEAKNESEIKKLRGQMQERYERERTNSLRELASRLGNRNKNISNKEIIQSIKDKNKNLGQLLFFNNVITSYLSIQDRESGEMIGRNLAPLKRELAGGGEQNLPTGLNEDFVQQLKSLLPTLEREGDTGPQKESKGRNPTFSPGEVYREVLGDPAAYQREED